MKKKWSPFSALTKKQKKSIRKTILGKSFAIIACSILLTWLYLVSYSQLDDKDQEVDNLTNQVNQLQKSLDRNISQIENLTALVEDLNKQAVQLRSIADKKALENKKLKQQALDLSNAIIEFEAQLDCLEMNEQIYLLVDRLRNSNYTSTDEP